jgi:putative exporter of polyketide antibiotics
MRGTVAVALSGGVVVVLLFIIGCTVALSRSLDVDEVLSTVVASGRTYADALNDFPSLRS